MTQEQVAASTREIERLANHNQKLQGELTRANNECHKFAEEVLDTNAKIERLRHDSANLRAEKKIWEVIQFTEFCSYRVLKKFQGVQSRLVEENRTLAIERSHLSDLMANVQKIYNDVERSGENDRGRLESRIQMLEDQT